MNNKTKETAFQISAVLILISAALYLFNPIIAPFVMIVGVIGFAVTTFLMRYTGKSLRAKRLFNIQVFAVLMMVAAACLMLMHKNEWVILMLIAALLTLYVSVILPRAIKNDETEK